MRLKTLWTERIFSIRLIHINCFCNYSGIQNSSLITDDLHDCHSALDAESRFLTTLDSRLRGNDLSSYLFFNLLRPNSYKENKTPWQIAKEKNPDLSIEVAKIQPVFLDDLFDDLLDKLGERELDKKLELLPQGGYDVSSVP